MEKNIFRLLIPVSVIIFFAGVLVYICELFNEWVPGGIVSAAEVILLLGILFYKRAYVPAVALAFGVVMVFLVDTVDRLDDMDEATRLAMDCYSCGMLFFGCLLVAGQIFGRFLLQKGQRHKKEEPEAGKRSIAEKSMYLFATAFVLLLPVLYADEKCNLKLPFTGLVSEIVLFSLFAGLIAFLVVFIRSAWHDYKAEKADAQKQKAYN